jgi:hypothetical protein
MKYISMVARILLGLVFVIFGLNHIHNFIPMTLPTGQAGDFLIILVQSHFILLVAVLQVLGGLLLLFNRYVPLGLTLLGPIVVCIFLFNSLMAPSGLGIAAVIVVLYIIVLRHHKAAFQSLLTKNG